MGGEIPPCYRFRSQIGKASDCKSENYEFKSHRNLYVLCGLWTGTVETIGCVLCSLDESSTSADVMRKTILFWDFIEYQFS